MTRRRRLPEADRLDELTLTVALTSSAAARRSLTGCFPSGGTLIELERFGKAAHEQLGSIREAVEWVIGERQGSRLSAKLLQGVRPG